MATDLNDVIEKAKNMEREWREAEQDDGLQPAYTLGLYHCSLQMRFFIRDLESLLASHQAIVMQASAVMRMLEEHGASIVPHLIDNDDNAGQRLREALQHAGAWEDHAEPHIGVPGSADDEESQEVHRD